MAAERIRDRPTQNVNMGMPRSHPRADENPLNKLFVGGLDLRMSEGTVIKLFEPFGKIAHFDYLWHTNGPKRGEPRGFCFVEYRRREDAEKAQQALNNKVVAGRALVVNFAQERRFEFEPKSRKNYLERERDYEKRMAAQRKDREQEALAQQMASYTLPVTLTTDQKIAFLESKLKRIEAAGTQAPATVPPPIVRYPAMPPRPNPYGYGAGSASGPK